MKTYSSLDIAETSLFVSLMIFSAFFKIPNPFLPLVPITFQLFFAILAGLILGSRKALLSQIIYLALGLMGLPVFAYGGGIAYIFNPSFGFIIGFLFAAYFTGLLREKLGYKLKGIYLASFLGIILIYFFGILYFCMIKNLFLYEQISLYKGFFIMLPFMIKDLILISLNGIIIPPLLQALAKLRT